MLFLAKWESGREEPRYKIKRTFNNVSIAVSFRHEEIVCTNSRWDLWIGKIFNKDREKIK